MTHKSYKDDGNLSKSVEYSYDSAGNLLTIANYNIEDESLDYVNKYVYDDSDNLRQLIKYVWETEDAVIETEPQS